MRFTTVPPQTAALVSLWPSGLNVAAGYTEVPDAIPMPRRQVAAALRLLATALDEQADQAEAHA